MTMKKAAGDTLFILSLPILLPIVGIVEALSWLIRKIKAIRGQREFKKATAKRTHSCAKWGHTWCFDSTLERWYCEHCSIPDQFENPSKKPLA
jgi:hypothetical protein